MERDLPENVSNIFSKFLARCKKYQDAKDYFYFYVK
jgi:hypothetical protein